MSYAMYIGRSSDTSRASFLQLARAFRLYSSPHQFIKWGNILRATGKEEGKKRWGSYPCACYQGFAINVSTIDASNPLSLPVLLSFYYYDFFLDVIIQYFSPLRLVRWGDVMEISTTTRIRTKRGKRNHHPRNLLLPSLLLLLCLSKRRPERGNALSTSGRGVVLKKTGGCGRRRVVVRRQKQGGKRRKKKWIKE